ncbi:hypothetical protein PF003_g37306 [Phytophthora fragariae]|nr:hypothetical protein PF003_g37301 [Phytophthora fragariae]KAE8878692.1 hypothetical protein PF003_g37306 [Phytophthora fragariae]
MELPISMSASNSPTPNGPSQPSRQNAPTTPRANATANGSENGQWGASASVVERSVALKALTLGPWLDVTVR